MMKLYIDADGCPVVENTIRIAKESALECILLCDTSHVFDREGARTITVSRGPDSVDFALVNLLHKGDIVVTQDYGLSAMCLAKGALALSQNGLVYDNTNIDALLLLRHTSKKIRMAGGRTRCQPKRVKAQDDAFEAALRALIAPNRTV